jgi:hypothetical protein
MHVCIDEDTHLFTHLKCGTGSVPLRKRTVEVSSDLRTRGPGGLARTSPSTFLFLLSSQFQRADPVILADPNVIGSLGFHILSGNRASGPVARQWLCPFRKPPSGCPAVALPFQKTAEQWERQALASSALAGCSRGVSACQHPIFNFRPGPETENLRTRISFVSQWLASVITAFPQRRLSDGRVIWAPPFAVNSPK